MGRADLSRGEGSIRVQRRAPADLYSLGCSFYYLLTGKLPFGDCSLMEADMHQSARAPAGGSAPGDPQRSQP